MARTDTLGIVLDKIDQRIFNRIQSDKQMENQLQSQAMLGLLQMEMQNTQLYKQELIDKGLSLDMVDQTGGFPNLVNNVAGNSDRTSNFANTFQTMVQNNRMSEQLLANYNAGTNLGSELRTKFAASSEDKTALESIRYSPEEQIEALSYALKQGIITQKQFDNPAFRKGMILKEQDAFAYLQFQTTARTAEAQMKKLELELTEKELSITNSAYHSALGNAGNIILNKMSYAIPPGLKDKVEDFNLVKFLNLNNRPATTNDEKAAKKVFQQQYDDIIDALKKSYHEEVVVNIERALGHYINTENTSGTNNAYTQFGYLSGTILEDFDTITAYEHRAIKSGLISGTVDPRDGEIIEEELDFLETLDDVIEHPNGNTYTYKELRFKIDSWASLGLGFDRDILEGMNSFQKNMESRIDDKQNELFMRAVGENTFDYNMYNSYPGSYNYEKTQEEFEVDGNVDVMYQDSFVKNQDEIPSLLPITDAIIDENNKDLLELSMELEGQGTKDPSIERLEEIDIWMEENPVGIRPQTIEEGREWNALLAERQRLTTERADIEQTMADELISILENAGYVVHSGRWIGAHAKWMRNIYEKSGFISPEDILKDVNANPSKYEYSGISKPRTGTK